MEVKEEVKEQSKLNESSLTDLPVTNEQADVTKGGPAPNFAGTWTLDKSKTH